MAKEDYVSTDLGYDNDEPSPRYSWRSGYETYTETDPLLVETLRVLLVGRWKSLYGYPSFTVHSCWSGYSSYTITDEWSEIEITWGEHHLYYESVAEFFRALAAVDLKGY